MSQPTIQPDGRPARHVVLAVASGVGLAVTISLVAPSAVAAHQLTGRFASPIPLGAYLAAAAFAVGLSFAVVFFRGGIPSPTVPDPARDRVLRLAPAIRLTLEAAGLLAWTWIVAQAVIVGRESEGDVASLFLWVYGWVGLALASAFVGPVWQWLDPFASLHRGAAALLGRLGIRGAAPAPYPARLGRWPAIVGFAVFIWLELAVPEARGGHTLGLILVAYTVLTLVAMAQFGREEWRRNGEVFSVWFATIGRLAPLAITTNDRAASSADRLRVRRFATGLLDADRDVATLVLVAFATAAILFDGLSQTQAFFDAFGVPDLIERTLLLGGWLALVAGLALLVGRLVGVPALIAGLIPIAVGYLVAHYLTYLLFDGQRILLALDDPLGLGWHLQGLEEYEPATSWLPGAVAWTAQLVAVVGGHAIGAWAGHAVALRTADEHFGAAGPDRGREIRLRQVPLALLMVGLTTVTLWSLGQAVVKPAEEQNAVAPRDLALARPDLRPRSRSAANYSTEVRW